MRQINEKYNPTTIFFKILLEKLGTFTCKHYSKYMPIETGVKSYNRAKC